MTSAAQRLDDFAMGRGTPYTVDLAGVDRAMRDMEAVFGPLLKVAPIRRDQRVRVRATGREAKVMLVRDSGDVTVRYEDKTCETMRASAVEAIG